MDYFHALERQSQCVTLDGIKQEVKCVPLGAHVHLLVLFDEIVELIRSDSPIADVELPMLMAEYLSVALDKNGKGLLKHNTIAAVVQAFAVLGILHRPDPHNAMLRYAAWEKGQPPPPGQPQRKPRRAKSYRGEYLAHLVHRLAASYGWQRDYILHELGLDEALMYVMEIERAEHTENAYRYNIAGDVGLVKVGEKYIKEPFPPLRWDREFEKGEQEDALSEETIRVPIEVERMFTPGGYIDPRQGEEIING